MQNLIETFKKIGPLSQEGEKALLWLSKNWSSYFD